MRRDILGIGVWDGAVAFCALLLKWISRRGRLAEGRRRDVAASRCFSRIAGYLLFFNDQGRELGVSLLGEKYGWQIFFPVPCPHLLGRQHLAYGEARDPRRA